MRVLKPEVAKERENNLLRWIVQEFVSTRRPVGSELVAEKARLGVSSATVRGIMKRLEDDGYLHQEHTSGGRVPTDKAYRFYVDYLSGAQALALKEKEKIQSEYDREMDEMDALLTQTSRMLAALSHSAGFAYSSSVRGQNIVRLDFIPLGPSAILAVLVTDSGSIRHFPLRLNYEIPARRLRLLASFINQEVTGLPFSEAKHKLWHYLSDEHSEVRDVADLARQFLEDVERQAGGGEDLHIEGLGQLVGQSSDFPGLRDMLNVMEERRRLAGLFDEKLRDMAARPASRLNVAIGAENELRELRGLSMITCSYRAGERTAGMLGIIGPRHMEYSRMISLVNFMGELVEKTIGHWEKMLAPGNRVIPLDFKSPGYEIPDTGGGDPPKKPARAQSSAKAQGKRGKRK